MKTNYIIFTSLIKNFISIKSQKMFPSLYIDFFSDISKKSCPIKKSHLKKQRIKKYYLDKVFLSNQSNLFIQYFYNNSKNSCYSVSGRL